MGNPIFNRSSTFNGQQPVPVPVQYGQQQYGQQAPYGQQYGQQPYGYGQQPQQYQAAEKLMTLDDVITKTAISLVMVAGVAAVAYLMLPLAFVYPALLASALLGFVTVMIVSARRTVNPVGLFIYALVEGLFVGAFTKVFEYQYPGIATQAVLATFAVAGVTLAAYKFFNIRVTPKFRRMIFIATAGFAVLMLGNFVFSLFTQSAGLRGGALGLLVGIVACGLAVLNLVTDFDYVERGIASRAPASESWRAALGITVTMVWLYTEILRILSYFRR
ncbi:Bax inhibitor-1/YccA family protein [Aestuariimicrobium soli]|uniref:Bax inhibitor-1/YccA family protein n=1 Tax=Aestuariimicrobium soli TaxID=2035834 RepID=UPI003EB6F35B